MDQEPVWMRLWQDPYLTAQERVVRVRVAVTVAEPGPPLRLRIRLRLARRVRSVRQVEPTADLTARLVGAMGSVELPLGAGWSGDREYEIGFDIDPSAGPHGEDLQAAVIELGEVTDTGFRRMGRGKAVRAHWSDPPGPHPATSTRDGGELGNAIWAGCEAYEAGDLERARRHWQLAQNLARRSGDEDSLRRLNRLVEPDWLRPDDLIEAGRVQASAELSAAAQVLTCPGPDCGRPAAESDEFCEQCGRPLRAVGAT
ncbi:hypothetical protein [Saccharopolyspora sp. 5N708]|uniref:hypothetical protein n=1 Tax=Saccharopolyspora sp. 5N708 TaxID=3457424 RepID=UPI003FD3A116